MRILTLVASCLLPLPALALSCLPYGVTDAYLQAEQAEEAYLPVLGELTFDPAMLPRVDWDKQQEVPATTLIPAIFKGGALGPRNVAQDFETDVVLEVNCAGPWCPSPQPGDMLGFLRKTSHGYVLSVGACGGFHFGQPNLATIRQVKECLSGRACDPSIPR